MVNLPSEIKTVKFNLRIRHFHEHNIPSGMFQQLDWSDAEDNLLAKDNLSSVQFFLETSDVYFGYWACGEEGLTDYEMGSRLHGVIAKSLPRLYDRDLLRIRMIHYSRVRHCKW